MHAILKPEAKRCLGLFDDYLRRYNFSVASRHSIPNWKAFAEQFYAQQIKEEPSFKARFDRAISTINSYFGNNALLLMLEREGDYMENIRQLMEIKIIFRREVEARLPEPAQELVNANCLKYVHISEPDLERIRRELIVIKESGVLGKKISFEEWQKMLELNTLNPADITLDC